MKAVIKKCFSIQTTFRYIFLLVVITSLYSCGDSYSYFSVSGVATGVTGPVVLRLNGKEKITLKSSGKFEFASQFEKGSSYRVSTLSYPLGLVCTVSHGTGKIEQDVINVKVTCSKFLFTVGGTVTGLNGTLVLQNNATDDLMLTNNGSFTFDQTVADGSDYEVTLAQKPSSQNCFVLHESGVIRSGNIKNIEIICTDWTYPANFSDNISPDGQFAYHPQVAMDHNGNKIIVWEQFDGSNRQIFKSEYRSGVWTHPSGLSDNISPDGPNAMYPQVAMDDNGNAIVVWYEISGAFYQIFKSEYRSGVWTNPSSINDMISIDGQMALYAQVAMDNNGNAIIVWQESDGTNNQIFKSEYRLGAWTHPSGLSDNISIDGQEAEYPQVAMDNNGNAIIAWQQSDGTVTQIFKSEYRSGMWTHPASLSDNISPNAQNAGMAQIAMDQNGNAIIVWEQSDGASDQVFKSEYRSGTWTHPTSLSDNISPDSRYALNPQVKMDDNGNAIIVWAEGDSVSVNQVFKSEYRLGAWTNPSSLNDNISPDTQDVFVPQLAMDNNGNAIIVWQQYDKDGLFQVFKSEYRYGKWSHPISLDDHISLAGQHAMDPDVAMDNNGNAVIAWHQSDGASYQIFKSEY